MPKHVLFVCGKNKHRSRAAEDLFINHNTVVAQSAGLSPEADIVLDADLVEWAQIIYVMSQKQADTLKSRFKGHLNNKKIISLGIKDKYEYGDPELVAILKKKLQRLL